MRRFSTVLLASLLGLGGLLSTATQAAGKVNGSVEVAAGQPAADATTVNGSVHIADGARVQKASTVNGAVDLGAHAQADRLGTVNGAISLGADSRVSGQVHAVNGRIDLAQGAQVGGRLANVNGDITLHAAQVDGGIETVAGDITIGAGSHVEGGILVDKPGGWFHQGERTPTVVIGPHAVVQGTLEFRRPVVLKVSDSAQIGPVKGASAQKFSGATP